jgi:hypothetical protein
MASWRAGDFGRAEKSFLVLFFKKELLPRFWRAARIVGLNIFSPLSKLHLAGTHDRPLTS